MDNWEHVQKKIEISEIAVAIIVVATLIFGVVCDVLVKCGIVFVVVHNLDSVSLTLLQIQGAITTLTLMIITIMSGYISESYMGVSVSQFFLEKRPYILKQSRIIIFEFVCLAISIWGHIFGKYNLVIALFMVALLLIVVSIVEIYEVFKGKKNSCGEISIYVKYQIERGTKYRDVITSFIDDWKREALQQSSDEFERFFELFILYTERCLIEEDVNIDSINEPWEKIVLYFLRQENEYIRIRGLRLSCDFYELLWRWIDKNREKAKTILGKIHLIDNIAHDWYLAIDSLDAEIVEKNIRWNNFSESVIRVSAWIGKVEKDKYGDVSAVNSLGRTFGAYIAKQYKKGNLVDTSWWEQLLNNRVGYRAFGIPEESADYYREALIMRDFNICYGYLLNGHLELIKNAIFLDGVANTYVIDCTEEVLRIMLIHCFMYYLGFRESVNCIDPDIQKKIADILQDGQVINAINHFYYRVIEEKIQLSEYLEEKMESILERYELFPKHSNGKTIIIEGIVKEYFLYVALIFERYSFDKKSFADMLNVDKYHSYLFEVNRQSLRRHFVEMGYLFSAGEHSDVKGLKKSDDMLSIFDLVMKEKYKNSIMNTAIESQKDFDNNGIKASTEAKIRNVIQEKFKSLFGGMNKHVKGVKKYNKVHVLRCNDFTKGLGDNLENVYSDYPFGNFCGWLMHELENTFDMKVVDRDKDFASDQDFRRYMKEKGYVVFVGSQYAFGCKDFSEYKEHTDFLSSSHCVFTPTAHGGLACTDDALYIKLDDIIVEINSPKLTDIDFKKNEETGLIYYSPISGITLEFNESELQSYLHNQRKVIDIFFSVTIGVRKKAKKELGTLVVRKNNE